MESGSRVTGDFVIYDLRSMRLCSGQVYDFLFSRVISEIRGYRLFLCVLGALGGHLDLLFSIYYWLFLSGVCDSNNRVNRCKSVSDIK
jgi:hypothetical protein